MKADQSPWKTHKLNEFLKWSSTGGIILVIMREYEQQKEEILMIKNNLNRLQAKL